MDAKDATSAYTLDLSPPHERIVRTSPRDSQSILRSCFSAPALLTSMTDRYFANLDLFSLFFLSPAIMKRGKESGLGKLEGFSIVFHISFVHFLCFFCDVSDLSCYSVLHFPYQLQMYN